MYCASHLKENVLHPTCSIKTFNRQRSLILRWNPGTWWASGSPALRAGAESGCCCRQNPVQTESWPLAGAGGRGDHLPSEPPLVPPCQFGRRQTNGAVCLPVSTRSKAHVDRWTKCFWPDDKIFGIFFTIGTLWRPLCLLLRYLGVWSFCVNVKPYFKYTIEKNDKCVLVLYVVLLPILSSSKVFTPRLNLRRHSGSTPRLALRMCPWVIFLRSLKMSQDFFF